MTNPVTHLLWGYSISKNISKKKELIIFGTFMSIILDIDYLPLPGLKHHGFIHTPIFVIILSLIFYLATRSKYILIISFVNMLFHLILDTLGTRAPVMWLWPLNESSFALGTEISLIALIIIKLILFLIPLGYIIYCYYKFEENPLDIIDYLKEKFGIKATYAFLIIFSLLIIYIGITEYLLKLI